MCPVIDTKGLFRSPSPSLEYSFQASRGITDLLFFLYHLHTEQCWYVRRIQEIFIRWVNVLIIRLISALYSVSLHEWTVLVPTRRLSSYWILKCVFVLGLSCSVMSDSETLWTIARQAPLSTGFSRQKPWSGLPCCPLGHLPGTRVKSTSASPALQADSLLLRRQRNP